MRQHLETLGWGGRYLDDSGIFARVGVKNSASCLEPFNRLQRILTRKKLPIAEVITRGMGVKFLKSLKHEMCVSVPILSHPIYWLFDRILSFIGGRDSSTLPIFMGFIDGAQAQQDFDQFPFDEWLTVSFVGDFDTMYTAPNGRIWTVNHIALASVTQVEISQQPPVQATNEWNTAAYWAAYKKSQPLFKQ